MGIAATALSSGVLVADNARAQTTSSSIGTDAITRRVPFTGEALPVIGLGTFFTFDVIPGESRDHLRDVIRIYWEGGARVIDTSPLYGSGEISVGDFTTSLGINEQVFFTDKIIRPLRKTLPSWIRPPINWKNPPPK